MNHYLLLRNNQQTGPYTAEELKSKGLKAYDLLWVEGKSAAWRYPSEIDELKPFAPVIEEQPFDRFYKKPAPVNKTPRDSEKKLSPVKTLNERSQEKQKKIYVTFPGKAASNGERRPLIQDSDPALVKKTNTEPVEAATTIYQPTTRNKPVRNVWMHLIVGVCLILTGLLIGLFISNQKQRANLDRLSEMVAQISQRENRSPENQKQQASFTPLIAEEEPVLLIDSTQIIEVENSKPAVPEQQPKKKSAKPTQQTEISQPVVEIDFPEVSDVQPKKPPISLETARKNLRQQVSVENNDYKTGIFGGISDLKLILSNNSQFALDQVEVEITYFGPEKKKVKTQVVVFEHISPGKQMTLEVPRSSRGVSVDYTVKNIHSRELVSAHTSMNP